MRWKSGILNVESKDDDGVDFNDFPDFSDFERSVPVEKIEKAVTVSTRPLETTLDDLQRLEQEFGTCD